MGFEVSKPGLLSTLQDEGRFGFRKYGVIASGPMDSYAHRTANILVGNKADASTLEMTLSGPTLTAQKDMVIAICGADMEAEIDGTSMPLWRPFNIYQGEQLAIHYARQGCRAYLAVSGGFEGRSVLGSQSTYLRAGLGGYEGRGLQAGDQLNVGEGEVKRLAGNQPVGAVSTLIRPPYEENPTLRVTWGKEAAHFTEESRWQFAAQGFMVTPQSDRMGYRLKGDHLCMKEASPEMISEAVVQGTIQVPAGGQPILLMADCQTTGGYPRIAHVITADLPLVAQVKPGGTIRFEVVSHREAQEQLLLQAMDLRLLEAGMQAWYQDHGIT
ncbi:biotin-dependent carboxyltransferase family protein [Paenibacillus sp. HWE-109]|uniref:5-oxoprolinase subunit C family protein n=1 Tax=Paenibacillus sp. HWE-109 TaxID=1306526 RepID=UPI001EDF1B30|nr:biotin-dependent carboxyltransferase family protein [Paenibacillus sp. HWE-109]UKS24688.1 biotin-dependent carboxyltransferase family protein [Paenibacillus sp. HWE-109]